MAVTFGAIAIYFFYSRSRLEVSKELIQEERIKRLSSEKEALEANLRLLQAQIEPHFLFNTLSNVLSLIDSNPARGKSMLVDLIHYLRTSLSRTFPDPVTLDQEIEMIKAYLKLQLPSSLQTDVAPLRTCRSYNAFIPPAQNIDIPPNFRYKIK